MGTIRTGTTAGNTVLLQAYDTNGASYTTFGTLTAGNPPTFTFATTLTPQFARLGLGAAADGTIPLLVSGTVDNLAKILQTSTGEAGFQWARSGGTISNWTAYLPSASTDLRLWANAGDRFTFTQAGTLYATGGFKVGADNTNNLIDDASNGAGSTTLYIGNQSITVSSDRRIKTDIQPSTLDASKAIAKLSVVDFRYADDACQAATYNGKKRIPGLIAQDVQKVLPMFINTNGVPAEGPIEPGQEWKIDYQGMVPVLVKALQELSAENDALESRLAALEGKAK